MKIAAAVLGLFAALLSACTDNTRIEKLEQRVAADEGRANVFSARIAELEAQNIDLKSQIQLLRAKGTAAPDNDLGRIIGLTPSERRALEGHE